MSSEINAIAIIFFAKYCLSITHIVLGAIVCVGVLYTSIQNFDIKSISLSLSMFWEELGLCYTPILQEFIAEGVRWWVGE